MNFKLFQVIKKYSFSIIEHHISRNKLVLKNITRNFSPLIFTLTMRTFHTPFSPYNTHLSAELPQLPLRATAQDEGVIFVVPEREERQAASPERYRFFILIINFKIKQT